MSEYALADGLAPPDPCRAAIPQRPLCAASGLVGCRHRIDAAVVFAVQLVDGRVWRFCSERCLTAWHEVLAGAAS